MRLPTTEKFILIPCLVSLISILYSGSSYAGNEMLICNFTSAEDVTGTSNYEYLPIGKVSISYNGKSDNVIINLHENDFSDRSYNFTENGSQLIFTSELGKYKSQNETWIKSQYIFDTTNGKIIRDYENKVSLKSDAHHSRQFGTCEVKKPDEYLCIATASTYPFWDKDDLKPDLNGYENLFMNRNKYKVRTGAQLELEVQSQGMTKDSSPSEWREVDLRILDESDNLGYRINSKYSPGLTTFSFDPELRRLMVNDTSKYFKSQTSFYECTKL